MALYLNKDTVYRAAKPRDKECFINDAEGFIWSSEKTAPKYGSSSLPSKGSEKTFVWRASGHHVRKCQAQS
ncbi:hypothetical protein PL263_04225 [Methylomonas sp. EFPC3]|uniref:hypothetical protein n=1 Tax=Methylomonas sp. EFPC3 TaxID=3021710 RepID=UPI002416DFF9|nr:hypothetical protein [Methylomonas sp. EFPC3]WFP51236.1 hypothetical protein PL263_04225 [Methylomonas sp. EFPC3]